MLVIQSFTLSLTSVIGQYSVSDKFCGKETILI